MALCTLSVSVQEIAAALGVPLDQWEEPGLGNANGFSLALPSGMLLLLEELTHAREHLGAKGPTLYVDATDLARQGIQDAIATALAGLGLPAHSLVWSQGEAGLAEARQMIEASRAPS